MDDLNALWLSLTGIYWLVTMIWLIGCQFRMPVAFDVVIGDSYTMLLLGIFAAPLICLVIIYVHRWQMAQAGEHEQHAV